MRDTEKLPGLQIGGKFSWCPVHILYTKNLVSIDQLGCGIGELYKGGWNGCWKIGPCNLSNQRLPQAMTGARIHTSRSPDPAMFAATMEWVRITEADNSPDPA
jgi:hypothetical protein